MRSSISGIRESSAMFQVIVSIKSRQRGRLGTATSIGTASATYYTQEWFNCRINFSIPENDEKLSMEQRIEVYGESRSQAKELAAEFAYHFVVQYRLWSDLRRDAGIEPNLSDSINKFQELNQKGYVDKPEYEFKDFGAASAVTDWSCHCRCSGVYGHGRDKNKTQAKKQAAFEVLEKLFHSQSRQQVSKRTEMALMHRPRGTIPQKTARQNVKVKRLVH